VVEFVRPGPGLSRDVHWSSAATGNHSVEELKASRCGGGGIGNDGGPGPGVTELSQCRGGCDDWGLRPGVTEFI